MANGDTIRAARQRQRMSQGALAEAAGLTRQTVVDIEYGRIEVTEQTMMDLLGKIKRHRRVRREVAA